jgi:hypothetical protein
MKCELLSDIFLCRVTPSDTNFRGKRIYVKALLEYSAAQESQIAQWRIIEAVLGLD